MNVFYEVDRRFFNGNRWSHWLTYNVKFKTQAEAHAYVKEQTAFLQDAVAKLQEDRYETRVLRVTRKAVA